MSTYSKQMSFDHLQSPIQANMMPPSQFQTLNTTTNSRPKEGLLTQNFDQSRTGPLIQNMSARDGGFNYSENHSNHHASGQSTPVRSSNAPNVTLPFKTEQ